MKSLTSSHFWKLYDALPGTIQRRADKAYEYWQVNPYAHGLYFKLVSKKQPLYSVRIGRGYRALGMLEDGAILWFWIGPHDEYDRLLKDL